VKRYPAVTFMRWALHLMGIFAAVATAFMPPPGFGGEA